MPHSAIRRTICWVAGCFLLLAAPVAAQDLHMYYDLFTDSISYRKDGKLVSNPKIRRGDFIVLHFTEFNPYLYEAKVEIEQNNTENWPGAASSGALGLAAGLGVVSPLLGGMGASTDAASPLSFLDIPLLRMGENSMSLKDLFGGARGSEQILQQAQIQLQALAATQARMAQLYADIQRLEKSERAAQLAARHLDQLLLSPRMRPSLIRKVAAEYLALIFPEKSGSGLELDDAFQWQERPMRKRRMLQELEGQQRKYDSQLLSLTPIADQLGNFNDPNSAGIQEFAGELRDITEKSGSLRQQLEAYLQRQNDQDTRTLTVEEMLTLQMKFRELADQSFSYDVAISVEKTTVLVTAEFVPFDTATTANRANLPPSKFKVVKIITRGGLQISPAFGLAFSRMFDPVQEFSAREGRIVADGGGIVQPSLTTYLHFYPAHTSGLALAGTFGVGIPLSSSNLSSLNFFLGPSLLFGRSQRIVLSGGLTAGPAQRLAKGFKVGDPFDPAAGDIPVRSQYELGYFVGISFNLGG